MLRKLPLFAVGLVFQTTVVQAQNQPVYRTVFTSDSINVRYPTVSPDERWLVFTALVSDGAKLMIQPLAGGPPRDLFAVKGYHDYPRFVPAGDRLVFVSNLPSRGPADTERYLVSVPFDTRTGELSGPPRQISLEGVSVGGWGNPAISPDGRSIAYLGNVTSTIKVIPLTGGTARTLVEPSGFPTSLAWSPDGRFLSYEIAEGPQFVRMQVSLDGGAPIVKGRSSERLGPLSQDGRYSFSISFGRSTGPSNLRWFDVNGRLLGETKLPPHVHVLSNVGASGRYIPVAREFLRSSVKVVPVAGGPIRKVSPGNSWDLPGGWSADGQLVQVLTEDEGHAVLAQYTIHGELKGQVRLPDDVYGRMLWIRDGHMIYRGDVNTPESTRLMAISLKDGSRKELAQGFLPGSVLPPLGAGYVVADGEFYYRQSRGRRVELRAMRPGGQSRLIGELPASALASAAVFQNRIIYTETVKDTIRRLQLVPGPGKPAQTLATLGAAPYVTWSQDGRQLLVSVGTTQKLFIYAFDADGNVQGSPKPIVLPFGEWSNAQWLPDGSGLTMIARPPGSKVREVVVVRLADPQHPVVLTKDDPETKNLYVLSPDGKYVAYSSSEGKGGSPFQRHLSGSSIYLIDLAQVLKQLQARK